MILSELKKTKGNKIIKHQVYDVVCDKCSNEYKLSYFYIIKGRNKYNDLDLCFNCKLKHQYKIGIRDNQRSLISKHIIKTQTGIKYKERYGEKRAEEIKQKISKNNYLKGKKWIDVMSEDEYKNRIKTASETLKEIRKNIDQTGEKNPMFGKIPSILSGTGISGKYKNYSFRSLLELYYIIYLDKNNIRFKSAEENQFKIIYKLNGKKRNYWPDFYLLDEDKIVEIKPSHRINEYRNKIKMESAKRVWGNKYICLTEKNIKEPSVAELLELYNNNVIKFGDKNKIRFFNNLKRKGLIL